MEIVQVTECPGYKNKIGVMKPENFVEFMHLLMMNQYRQHFPYIIPPSFEKPPEDFSI